MENSICIDTDCLVDFLRKKPEAVLWVQEWGEKASLSTTLINVFELYFGAYKSVNHKKYRSIGKTF